MPRGVRNTPAKKDKEKEAKGSKETEKVEKAPQTKSPKASKANQKVEQKEEKNKATPAVPARRGGRKRSASDSSANAHQQTSSVVHSAKKRHLAFPPLTYKEFVNEDNWGTRVLSCGEGDQLGHPGRSTTKKPRMVDVFEEMNSKYIQVVAGGVHSAVLTLDGEVYMCGINEKGTVPAEGVEPEGSTSEFTIVRFSDQIIKHGKMVMLAAGASFTAALTDKGTVVAWGNLRDSSGEIDVHPLLHEMKDHPVIIVNYKDRRIVKVAAGENHLVMLDESGHVLTFGDGTMGQLGRSTRTGTIRSKYMCDSSGNSLLVHARKGRKDIFFKNIFAGGFWTLCVSQDGDVFGFGLNNFDQLGIKMPEFDETKAGEGGEDERELRVKLPAISENWAGSIWTHMDGVQHLAARNHNGEIWVVGKNTDNALGLGTWTGNDDKEHWKYDKPQKLVLDENAVGVTAGLASTIIWTEEGSAYAFGCDTTGQLGLGIKEDDDEKVVPTPQEITSAHLDGHNIVGVSLADMHALFLARKQSDDEEMKEEKEEKKVNKVDKEHKKEATPVQRPEVEEKEEKVDEEKPDEKMDTSEDHADEENGTGTGAESDQGENATEAEPVPSTQDDQEEQTPAME